MKPSAFPQHRGKRIEWLVLLLAFLLVNVLGATLQKRISFHDGKGWEGVAYYEMAEQMAAGRWPVSAVAPCAYRTGTPFLVSLLYRAGISHDLFVCFTLVNLAANALSLALLVVWLRRLVGDWRIRVALGLMFLLQWDTPARWLYFYPVHTDPWMWVFLLGGLIAVDSLRRGAEGSVLAGLCAISFCGVIFREIVLVVPLTLLFACNPVARWRASAAGGWREAIKNIRPPPLAYFLPLACGAAGLAVTRLVARQTDTYSFGRTALHWAYDKPVLTYLHGWFLAFGPALWLVIIFWRRARTFLAENEFLAVYLAAFALLGYIGGTDTERLIYWSMPAVYVLLGKVLEDERERLMKSRPLMAVLVICQLIASRALFWPSPDHPSDAPSALPLFTPFGRRVPLMDLFSFFAARPIEALSLVEYLVFGAILFAWLKRQPRDRASAT